MKRPTIAAVVLSTPLWVAGISSAQEGTGRYFDHGEMMGWSGWFYGPMMMVIFFGLLVGAVVLIVRLIGGDQRGDNAPRRDRAHAILRERFAHGEITREEFEAARKVLD